MNLSFLSVSLKFYDKDETVSVFTWTDIVENGSREWYPRKLHAKCHFPTSLWKS
jgi:hypothetical protein